MKKKYGSRLEFLLKASQEEYDSQWTPEELDREAEETEPLDLCDEITIDEYPQHQDTHRPGWATNPDEDDFLEDDYSEESFA